MPGTAGKAALPAVTATPPFLAGKKKGSRSSSSSSEAGDTTDDQPARKGVFALFPPKDSEVYERTELPMELDSEQRTLPSIAAPNVHNGSSSSLSSETAAAP